MKVLCCGKRKAYSVIALVLAGVATMIWWQSPSTPRTRSELESFAQRASTTSADVIAIAADDGERGNICLAARGFRGDDLRALSRFLLAGGKVKSGHGALANSFALWERYGPKEVVGTRDGEMRRKALELLCDQAADIEEIRTVLTTAAHCAGLDDEYTPERIGSLREGEIERVQRTIFAEYQRICASGPVLRPLD